MRTDRNSRTNMTASAASAIVGLFTGAVPATAADGEITPNDERQTSDGCGAAGGPCNKAGSIHRIPGEAVREHMLDLPFSRQQGICVAIRRLIVGDGGFNCFDRGNDYEDSADTIWPGKDGGFAWAAPGWAARRASLDSHPLWMTKAALARRCPCVRGALSRPEPAIRAVRPAVPHFAFRNIPVVSNRNSKTERSWK